MAWLGFFVTFKALSPFCSLHRNDRSQPVASFLMNCQLTPTPWCCNSFLNCGERQPQMKIIAMISCWVISLRSHSSARSKNLLKYCTIDSSRSWGSLNSSILLESKGCLSVIQLASMHDMMSSSFGSGVKMGVLSLMLLYRCCSSSRSTHPDRVACCPGMLVTPISEPR